jgi:macrolide-specific efflux system membrane fusion protein
MSLTINLIEQQATNVLEVPSQAITTKGGSSYVELKNSSGAMVQTVVTTGLTNFVDTQITSGLASGDVVVIATTKSSSATTTTSSGSVGLGISGGFSGGGGALR